MFIADADKERTCLRQGDVLEAIPFPILDSKAISVLGKIHEEKTQFPIPQISPVLQNHREDPHYFLGQVKMRLCYCAVTSHCCELEPRNEKLIAASFSVARLIHVKKSILSDSSKLDSLKANKNPIGGDPGYLDYFYIGVHEKMGTESWMVDYSQIISIPNTEFPGILRKKILQMQNRDRVKFKIKLATYLSRITDEEDNAGLRMPW
jgi:hypothetical protein